MSVIIEHGPVIATVFFFCAFIVVIGYAYWPGSKGRYEKYSNVPFENENKNVK
jgi:cbb3-type cytochrome oxidase subunit 3